MFNQSFKLLQIPNIERCKCLICLLMECCNYNIPYWRICFNELGVCICKVILKSPDKEISLRDIFSLIVVIFMSWVCIHIPNLMDNVFLHKNYAYKKEPLLQKINPSSFLVPFFFLFYYNDFGRLSLKFIDKKSPCKFIRTSIQSYSCWGWVWQVILRCKDWRSQALIVLGVG